MDKFSSPAKMFKSNLFKYLKRAGITVLSLALVLTSMITVAKDEALSYSKAKAIAVAEIETVAIDDLSYVKVEYDDLQNAIALGKVQARVANMETVTEAIAYAYNEVSTQVEASTASDVIADMSDEEEDVVVALEDAGDVTSAALASEVESVSEQTGLEVVENELAAISIEVANDSYSSGTYLGTYTATAYCGCSKCCGKSDGITASGTRATQGRTVAAPSTFAFGTELIINGVTYVVEDRGGSIKGNRIDIYFESHADALAFGRKTVDVYVK